jgi:aspartyl-tRNA(Asn)/glutamyl-tRNA(Gln) amidotransferase subunit A
MKVFDSLSVAVLGRAYRAGTLDPVVVTEALLALIDRRNPELHAFITVSHARARADAEASRERIRAGRPLGALDGIPIAIKDNVDVAGLACTAGSAALRHRIPAHDAPVAARLRAAGSVLLGKLNMHEGALGATTDNEAFGRCINPLHAGHTPGGSSGGSGAAVAAGLCSAAVGSDTMGSIRIPAAYCGVFGYKPGNDTVPAAGIVPLCHTLDVAGPLATTATDCAAMAAVMMGLDDPAGAVESAPGVDWKRLVIGVPGQLDQVTLEPAVAEGFRHFLDALKQRGARVVPIDLSHWDPTRARRAGLLASEADALDWWRAEIGHDLPGVSTTFGGMLRYAERAGHDKVDAARQVLHDLRSHATSAFNSVDLIALPTAPQASFAHDTPVPINQADLTALANFYACGAWAIPIVASHRVVSVQLMAAPGRDRWLLSFAPALDSLAPRSHDFAHALDLGNPAGR